MRPLLAALAPLALGVLVAAAPAIDWTQTANVTPKGAFVLGNPAAPLKLVEYGSYTCSHCAAFSKESEAVLKGRMIRSGKVSLEYRHLIRDPLDLGAAILARCTGRKGFFPTSAMIFATQDTWLAKAPAFAQAHPDLDGKPGIVQARALADGVGLTQAVRVRGLTPAQINACFADKVAVARITAMTGDAPIEVNSTPTFYLNNILQPPMAWAQLEPVLTGRGAK
ncbi:hypothetical protein D9601_00345 [Sphingomonas sp. MA1305]|uniref:DsbA family protein n=1 Tax=Sphingomonas sp. MA1305 TaxID=2479204 RepID=UPI0018DF214E|nr:thioredoxin domain-containing protein [Sphingomonas sp. MA1305]MBI0473812.1 hypothetical protein [Sphingomonas sp. MA1305]